MIKLSLPNSIIGDMFVHDHEGLAAGVIANHEMTIVNFLMKHLKSDSNFIDIGAYEGYFTLVASKKIKTGSIYSFEPCKGSYEILRRNVELHNLTNVKTFNMAISDNTSNSKFYWRPGAQCVSRIYDFPLDNNFNFTEIISTMSLNDFKEPIDYMKIDIEGAEVELFGGSKDFFNRNKQCKIILELHAMNIKQRYDVNLDKFLDLLQDMFNIYGFGMDKYSQDLIDEFYLPTFGSGHVILMSK